MSDTTHRRNMPSEIDLISDRQRLQLDIPLLKLIQLCLIADHYGKSKLDMAESILMDYVSNTENWATACAGLRQKAAMTGRSLNDLVVAIAEREKVKIDISEEINWEWINDHFL